MLKAVLFDLDGTITEPLLDFDSIRREAAVPAGTAILEHIERSAPAERERGLMILERHEQEAARNSTLNPGARRILKLAKSLGLRTGIVTRNSRKSVDTVLGRHGLHFDVVVTREDGPPKPSGEPVLLACRSLGVDPGDALMVGDFLFDAQAGKAAGARTAFYRRSHDLPDDLHVDYRLSSLLDLEKILLDMCSSEKSP